MARCLPASLTERMGLLFFLWFSKITLDIRHTTTGAAHDPEEGTRMVRIEEAAPVAGEPDATAQAVSQQQWRIYRTMVDRNYFFHREDFGHCRILLSEAPESFRFLDLGCGDAEIAGALKGTGIARYHGVDLSRAALNLAERSLAALACPVTLEERDVIAFLGDRPEPADVVWSGLLLHHFPAPAKLAALRAIRGVVGERGLLLLYEPASPDGEDRAGWLRRWDAQRPAWTAYAPADWDAFVAHVHAADFPETESRWHERDRGGVRHGTGGIRRAVGPAPALQLSRLTRTAAPRTSMHPVPPMHAFTKHKPVVCPCEPGFPRHRCYAG
jgi:SAM-dependent methyltransferase